MQPCVQRSSPHILLEFKGMGCLWSPNRYVFFHTYIINHIIYAVINHDVIIMQPVYILCTLGHSRTSITIYPYGFRPPLASLESV
jgi:hypothetical protein